MKSSNYKITINGKEHDVKGCPFCGEEPSIHLDRILPNDFDGFITCLSGECPAVSSSFHQIDNNVASIESAVNLWNARA